MGWYYIEDWHLTIYLDIKLLIICKSRNKKLKFLSFDLIWLEYYSQAFTQRPTSTMAIMPGIYYIYELLVFCMSTITEDFTLHHGIVAFIIANAALYPCLRLGQTDDDNDLSHMTLRNPDPTPRIVYRFYGVNLVLIGGLIAFNAMDQLRWTISALLISHGCTYMWLYRTRHFNEQPSVISPILPDGAKLVDDCSTLASDLQSKSPGLNLNV